MQAYGAYRKSIISEIRAIGHLEFVSSRPDHSNGQEIHTEQVIDIVFSSEDEYPIELG